MKRSASLPSAISAFERSTPGIATTPSIVWTKLATSVGRASPSAPP